jgi:hypothetical protein
VVLAHHGPEDCRDTVEIRDRLRHKASALLCGHKHDQRIQRVNDCVEIIAGAVHPEEKAGWYPTYNWIRFDVQPNADGNNTLSLEVWPRVLRPEWNHFGAGTGDGKPYRALLPLPVLAATPLSAAADATVTIAVAQRDVPEDLAAIELADVGVMRPPLVDLEGRVDEQRRITRDLLDLPVPDQERVLEACGLLTEDDLHQDHVAMILTALERAQDPGTLSGLAEEIARAKARAEGRTA